MSQKSAIKVFDGLAEAARAAGSDLLVEDLAANSATMAFDETLQAGSPSAEEKAAASAAIMEAGAKTLRDWLASGVPLPEGTNGDEFVRAIGRVLSS